MSSAAKRQIIEALDDLPEESLATVAELVADLRAKAVAGPVVRPPVEGANLGEPRKDFAAAYGAWRSSVVADDLDDGVGYFGSLRDASPGPDVTL